MMKYNIFILFLLMSCSQNQLSKAEYIIYSKDPENGLTTSVETNNWQYSIQYRSAEMMALTELNSDSDVKTDDYEKAIKEYQDMEYYIFDIKSLSSYPMKKEITDSLISHLNFEFRDQILLIEGLDTLRPELYHFENDLQMNNRYRFLTAFQKTSNQDKTFVIDHFFNDQNVSMTLKEEAFLNIPTLKL